MSFFKYGICHLLNYIHALFNKIFYPRVWAEGHVVPLHKTVSIDSVDYYRCITLLSHIGKLFTRILNNRLTTWAENYHVYIEAQAGFRKEMGTMDNIFVIKGIINHMLNSNKQLFVAWVDYKKAYGFVVRENMWYKLVKYEVRGNILNSIKSMYEHGKSRVKFDNQPSESYASTLGLAQGECLSSFLFSFYINDIEETLSSQGFKGIDLGMVKMYSLLYADDIVLFSELEEDLQNGIDILYDYCLRWK